MFVARFEPAIPASVRPQTHILERAATQMGETVQLPIPNLMKIHSANVQKFYVDGPRYNANMKGGFA